jgi:hypothetical protein
MVAILAFLVGVGSAGLAHKTSLEEITKDIKSYDGQSVELVTYLQLNPLGQIEPVNDYWILGERFEKPEAFTILDIETNSIKLGSLADELRVDYSRNNFRRVKVLVRGQVVNDCIKHELCCFTQQITITANQIEPLGQPEYYSVPDEFRANE